MEKTINNCTNGKCSRCGNCCGALPMPVTKQEVEIIAEYVHSNKIERKNREWVEPFESNETGLTIDLRCCFYNAEEKKCEIYEVRPEICRKFCCSNSEKQIDKDRSEAHRKAYYNNEKLENVTNFDILFYGDIEPIKIYFIYNTPQKDIDKMLYFLQEKLKLDYYKV
jgi:Fe-S-cluster containining protein